MTYLTINKVTYVRGEAAAVLVGRLGSAAGCQSAPVARLLPYLRAFLPGVKLSVRWAHRSVSVSIILERKIKLISWKWQSWAFSQPQLQSMAGIQSKIYQIKITAYIFFLFLCHKLCRWIRWEVSFERQKKLLYLIRHYFPIVLSCLWLGSFHFLVLPSHGILYLRLWQMPLLKVFDVCFTCNCFIKLGKQTSLKPI